MIAILNFQQPSQVDQTYNSTNKYPEDNSNIVPANKWNAFALRVLQAMVYTRCHVVIPSFKSGLGWVDYKLSDN
jgi:hypothetical protein